LEVKFSPLVGNLNERHFYVRSRKFFVMPEDTKSRIDPLIPLVVLLVICFVLFFSFMTEQQAMHVYHATAYRNSPMGSSTVHNILVFLKIEDEMDLAFGKGRKLAKKTAIGEGWIDVNFTINQRLQSLQECIDLKFSKEACQKTLKNGFFVMSQWKPVSRYESR